MSHPRNIIGPQVRALRMARDWTQQTMAARLNLLGWDISRDTLAKIESQLRWVADFELLCLASVLETDIESFWPAKKARAKAIREAMAQRT